MPRSKETPEDVRMSVVNAHQSGEGYKTIAKRFGIHRSTVRQIVYKWKKFKTTETLPRSGRPTKLSQRAIRKIIQHVQKNPKTTSKDLQASLAAADVYVHDSTIRRRLNSRDVHQRLSNRKPSLSKKNTDIKLGKTCQHDLSTWDKQVKAGKTFQECSVQNTCDEDQEKLAKPGPNSKT